MIDKTKFEKMWKEHEPSQHQLEYFLYLDWLDNYLKQQEIKNPVIVEIGIRFGQQSWYYIELLNATYIGIDIRPKDYSIPKPPLSYDYAVNLHPKALFFHANSQLKETKDKLIKVLDNKLINVLFIDADHRYSSAKKEWQLYGEITKNVVAFHDTNIIGNNNIATFWNELVRKEKLPCIEFRGRGVVEVYPKNKSTEGTPTRYLSSPGIGCILVDEMKKVPKLRHIYIDQYHFNLMKNQEDNYLKYEGDVV